MDQEETRGINFDLPKNRSNVIKVIGVGGGGSNAINYMFKQGIKGVDFVSQIQIHKPCQKVVYQQKFS